MCYSQILLLAPFCFPVSYDTFNSTFLSLFFLSCRVTARGEFSGETGERGS